ncbi:hypothetical protein M153_14700014358 [Pseudoloma neurophilia]|uniref:Uncharacterized protein n=1 Tax=Pseudoloma neurophilia TaxID=146866 RepID=A0A0R0M052_9MICR|nr:hypothetical protein M153_14700014358 [Pseudoloma neurophilia]
MSDNHKINFMIINNQNVKTTIDSLNKSQCPNIIKFNAETA